jgi:hypothetical protein
MAQSWEPEFVALWQAGTETAEIARQRWGSTTVGGNVMRVYDIYQGEELQASLIVHDDCRKEWQWHRHERRGQDWYDTLTTGIERAVDEDPAAERWTYQHFLVHQRRPV